MKLLFLRNFLFCIGVQSASNAVIASGEQRRDSAIPMYMCPFRPTAQATMEPGAELSAAQRGLTAYPF